MKSLFTTIVIILVTVFSCFAQKFKVTGFTGTDKRFDEVESNVMGKSVMLIVYDTSISLKIADDPADIIHHTTGDTYVLDLSKSGSKETQKLTVTLNKTFAYINSITVSFNVAENSGKYRSASWTMTAKRE